MFLFVICICSKKTISSKSLSYADTQLYVLPFSTLFVICNAKNWFIILYNVAVIRNKDIFV